MDLLNPALGLFFWTLLAFLVVFFILKKFAWKPILNMLDKREQGIADSIAAAERIKKEMSELKAENDRTAQLAREERAQMMKEAKEAKDKIINDAKEQAKNEAAKIVADAQSQIEMQKQAAMIDIKNQIGKLAVEVAEKVLRKELAGDQQQTGYAKMLAEEVALN